MSMPDPALPPLLSGYDVKAPLAPFEEACRLAEAGERGAGDVIWARNTQVADFAVVLEPDVPLSRAQQMAPLTMVALGDALGRLCPAKVTIQFRWPQTLLINNGEAGHVRLAAADCAADDVPRWLVVGVSVRLIQSDKTREPGELAAVTCLAEEGAMQATRSDVIEASVAHWMARLHNWQEDGFREVHDQWLFRAAGQSEPVAIVHEGKLYDGKVLGLDEDANLLIKCGEAPVEVLPYGGYVLQGGAVTGAAHTAAGRGA